MRAFITGITGQDGSYMAEFLLDKGYEVYGFARRRVDGDHQIAPWMKKVRLLAGDLRDQNSLERAIDTAQPHEVYNFAGQSFVPASWSEPALTADVSGTGVLRLLEALRKHSPKAKFLQPSSSEMFGAAREWPQTEETAFHPRNPYGLAKLFAHHATVNYRESCGVFACSAISFNHESPRRRHVFVTRKITETAARIKLGLADKLKLGNLDAKRDWGFAGDYVRAMWLMLQQPEPEDFVIATGELHSVLDAVQVAFGWVGLDWREHVEVDLTLVRPPEAGYLCGNAAKAQRLLGWRPKVCFKDMIEQMVESDLEAQQQCLTSGTAAAV